MQFTNFEAEWSSVLWALPNLKLTSQLELFNNSITGLREKGVRMTTIIHTPRYTMAHITLSDSAVYKARGREQLDLDLQTKKPTHEKHQD